MSLLSRHSPILGDAAFQLTTCLVTSFQENKLRNQNPGQEFVKATQDTFHLTLGVQYHRDRWGEAAPDPAELEGPHRQCRYQAYRHFVLWHLAAEHPLRKASRWSAKERKKVAVDQSFVVQLYNRSMSGTGRVDQGIGLYCIRMCRKKWWWPIFTWMPDANVFNAWVLHRLDEHGGMSLLDFRRKVARTLLAAPSHSSSESG
ncbi:PiggyBac transposable element-derived protein 2 [Amphibalanus amphitrite]|uniref:PiggyBac transposable element-derived protein 2 n=1 Tax=Amphibalanus amphitrite TaxID=1232801 RepID=A0A6A4VTU6_AMPAM|nr:PiggyBac transposable element-derived protein 2 [Amphibalanus amphitrite]